MDSRIDSIVDNAYKELDKWDTYRLRPRNPQPSAIAVVGIREGKEYEYNSVRAAARRWRGVIGIDSIKLCLRDGKKRKKWHWMTLEYFNNLPDED